MEEVSRQKIKPVTAFPNQSLSQGKGLTLSAPEAEVREL